MPNYTKPIVTLNHRILQQKFKIECPLCSCDKMLTERNEIGGVLITCRKCKSTINTTPYHGNLNNN